MTTDTRAISARLGSMDIVGGFVAGVLGYLVFHQLFIYIGPQIGLLPGGGGGPYQMRAVPPFGVPAVVSAAFWTGLWGVLFALLARSFPRGGRYFLYAFLFGAILPTLMQWFVVSPLRGQPMAAGWDVTRMWRPLIINGVFGLGVGVFYQLWQRWQGRPA